ncbi:cyclic nucleotide-binding domain-containing protein [Paenirhodobacter sp.]|jgi:CRP-like cAMP-binding protein|uniref:cyclic nucleotide-binding domain-containing protein n=1 Tax=Paenirhodobacter sp. TaxID=1965326 RepID=UPI003B504777
MLLEEEVALLRKLPIFEGVDPGRLKILCFASDRKSFEAGEVLFREGDMSFGAYVIISGSVDVHKESDDQHATKTGSAAGVDIIGQSSMLSDSPRRATVTALTDVEVLVINRSCFLHLMTSCRLSSEKIMKSLGTQLLDSEYRKPLGAHAL